ncbi:MULTISPECIES: hypothetical protein [unclassified Nocardiopsis]|nr:MULTISPECIES: hypothetical protein [unclassified Nocardiopsis]
MDLDWDTPYEEGEEFFYDDDGAFGVGLPPGADPPDHGENP